MNLACFALTLMPILTTLSFEEADADVEEKGDRKHTHSLWFYWNEMFLPEEAAVDEDCSALLCAPCDPDDAVLFTLDGNEDVSDDDSLLVKITKRTD